MIEVGGPPVVARELEAIGRTEDVRFSPSNRQLALAAYGRGAVVLVDVRIDGPPAGARVELRATVELPLHPGARPHGVDWLDEDTLVVADREGQVSILGVVRDDDGRPVELVPCPTPGSFEGTRSPGSVVVLGSSQGGEVLVCNNYGHTVTSHLLRGDVGVDASRTLLERWLDVPDGIAVSNHIPHLVMLYDRRRTLDADSRPDGVLRGVHYPHGLSFSPDGRHLVVADAGRPFVVAFTAPDGDWRGVRLPSAHLRAMTEEVFDRGRIRPQEGGPKGLDIDRSGVVLAVTSEHQPVTFFDASVAAGPDWTEPDGAELLSLEATILDEALARRDAAEERVRASLVVAREADTRARSLAAAQSGRRSAGALRRIVRRS